MRHNRPIIARKLSVLLSLVILALTLMAGMTDQAFAQTTTTAKQIIPVPTPRPDASGKTVDPLATETSANETFPDQDAILKLQAFAKGGKAKIEQNIVWRIFDETKGPDGKLPLLGTYSGGAVSFRLPSGYYLVHGAYGYAGLAQRVKVLPPVTERNFNIEVGGLRLNAAFRDGDFIPAKDLTFEIAQQDGDSLQTIVSDVRADEIIRLNPGPYHITSRYGSLNSEVTANVRVIPDQLTELTLYQRGAEITLKLVSELGGEAVANTSWTVLSPSGDTIVNSIASAFPRFVLAAGDYVAFARHEGENYSLNFTVESGVHRDVEVLMK